MDKNILKLELNKPKPNNIYNKTITPRVRSMLDDLYSGKIDEIKVSYMRSANKGITLMNMIWSINPMSRNDDPYHQRFICKCYDKNKPNSILFDFQCFGDSAIKPEDALLVNVLPVGEMLSKVKLTRPKNIKEKFLIPVLDQWISIDELPNEMSVQFRIANMYKMYLSTCWTFAYSGDDIPIGLPVFDFTGVNIVGCAGRRVEMTGNYSLLRLSGNAQIININNGDDILLSFCNNSDTRINIHKDYDVDQMQIMDINDIRREEYSEIIPKEYPTRVSINQMKDYVLINFVHYDSLTDKSVQVLSTIFKGDNINYYVNTNSEVGSKKIQKITYIRVEINKKKK